MIDDTSQGVGGEERDFGERLLHGVQAIAISPADAKDLVAKYRRKSEEKYPSSSPREHQERVAKKIVARYAKLAATSGGLTSLTSIVPGLGTAVAMLGGGTADTLICMKLQVDLCCCLAEAFEHDLNKEEAKHLAFLLAAGGALEKAGAGAATRIATKAGVNMLRQYLKGAALQAVKEFFKRLGVVFTRKALEKALPFGVGVVIGSGANYALTVYVGNQATEWFVIDRDMPMSGHSSAQ